MDGGGDAKAPFNLRSITNDPGKMGRYTPRNREQTFAMEYKTSYNSMCQHLEGRRSPIPPGYTGHQPGTLFKFGFGNPGSERVPANPEPDAFLDARELTSPPMPGEIRRSAAQCRVPFDSHRLSASAQSPRAQTAPINGTPGKKEGFGSRPDSRDTPRGFFRAEPPPAPTPTVNFQANEFPEEVNPVRYMQQKGRPIHFWPYYRPLGGEHLTPNPGAQYPPHPPDTVELRKMKSSYANAFLKGIKKALPFGGSEKPMEKSNREGMAGGYENNFTPLHAAWQGEDQTAKNAFSTSYKGAFTRAAVSPRRRKTRLGA